MARIQHETAKVKYTKQGFEALQKELTFLKTVTRKYLHEYQISKKKNRRQNVKNMR